MALQLAQDRSFSIWTSYQARQHLATAYRTTLSGILYAPWGMLERTMTKPKVPS